MKTSTKPYEILIRFDDKTGALKGAHFQTIETVTDDSGAVLFQKPGDPQPLDVAGKLATDLFGSTVVSAITVNDDLKAQLAAAQKSATDAATAAAQDKETALETLVQNHNFVLADKESDLQKLVNSLGAVTRERDTALAAQKTAEETLSALRSGQATLAKAAKEAVAAGDVEGIAAIVEEALKDDRQRTLDAAQAESDKAQQAASEAAAKVEALKAAQ